MTYIAKNSLSEEIVTALARLCQDFETQIAMYGDIPDLPEDMADALDAAIYRSTEDVIDRHPDIARLEALISEKAVILEHWTYDALENSEHWDQIRNQARHCLIRRGISLTPPEIEMTFVNVQNDTSGFVMPKIYRLISTFLGLIRRDK